MQEFKLLNRLYWVLLLFYSAIIVLLDYFIPNGITIGFLYIPIVISSAFLFGQNKQITATMLIAIICIAIGYSLSPDFNPENKQSYYYIIDRVINVVIVILTGLLCMGYLKTRNELESLKDHYNSMISHEIKTPIALIRNSIDFLNDELEGPLNSSQKEMVNMIQTQIKRLDHMLNDTLELSHLESGKFNIIPRLFYTHEVVNEVLQLHQSNQSNSHIAFEIIDNAQNIKIYTDYDLIFQVLNNLVGNAAKFTQDTIKIQIDLTDAKTIKISIHDNGPGIPNEQIKNLFNKFVQVKHLKHKTHKGTGLGLAICKTIIETLDGTIWVKSQLNKGTVFYFEIPVQKKARNQ